MLQYLHTIKSKDQERILFIPCTNVTFRKHQRILALILMWVGFLGVCLEVVGGGLSKTRKNYARNFKSRA